MDDYSYDVIIVGAGMAGLTAACYLSRAGKKVLLIEKNNECGGLVSTFNRDEFYFDAGVRALEDAGIIKPMLKDLGIEIEFVKSPVSIGIEKEILSIEDINSLQKYQDLLIKLYPESENEIKILLKIIKKIMKYMNVIYGIQNPAFKDLKNDKEFLFKELLPWLPKFILTIGKINKMNMPIEDYLDKIISNPSLKDIIDQHFFKNVPAFFALSYFSLYLDYIYPKGGVGKLAEGLVKKLIEFGGKLKLQTKIIEVEIGKCILKDNNNNLYKFNQLIWAADLKTFYKIAKTDNLNPKICQKFESVKRNILKNRGGESVFTLFLKVDEPLETFKNISNGHFFYTPSKQGLGETHRKELKNLISNWENLEKREILSWLDKFIKLNTFEISIPGLKDPNMVPEGKTGLIISFLAEYDLFKKAKDSMWYEDFVKEIEDRIINVMVNSIYPILKDKIIEKFSFTPISIENRVNSSEGAITGWSFQNPVPVVNKIQNSSKSILTPIPNIFQAGQWVYSPAGVPMSILTGKLAADKVLINLKKVKI